MSEHANVPSPEMIINTVDDHDTVLGTIARKFVLPTAHNFRVAHLLLSNSRGEILLQQLAHTRERHPLAWGASVAAYLFDGERYEDAIRRRVVQELGCDARDVHFLLKTAMRDADSTKFIGVFAGTSDGPFAPDITQIQRLDFVSPAQIERELHSDGRVFTPTFRHIFAAAGSHLLG